MLALLGSLLLRESSTQTECFDLPDRAESETVAEFHELDRLNRVFRFDHVFEWALPKWLGEDRCARLEILDVGAGTGLLGKRLSDFARRRGWDWRFTNLDSNPFGLRDGNAPNPVVGSALKLPFADGEFDLVVASQMTHHLSNADAVAHWREAWRVTRDGLFISDLHRNAWFYVMLWLTMLPLRFNRSLRKDALISVKRGFRRSEWREMANQAGISGVKIWLYFGTRIVLQARKGIL
jgi:SAM-dependent methyltransferase